MAPADVLRTCDAGERLQRALQTVLAADSGAADLKALLTDGGECTPAARTAAFEALVATSSADAVAALHELSTDTSHGLNLYAAARNLKSVALVPPQFNTSDTAAAFADADLESVGELIRYCSEDDDVAQHVGALALELADVGLDRQQIHDLVLAARALCAATSRLPDGGADQGVLGGVGTATIHAWESLEGELGVGEGELMSSSLSAALGAMSAEMAKGAGGGGGLAAAMMGLGGGGGGGLPDALRTMGEEVDLRDLDEANEAADVGQDAPGPVPGTHSVGC